MTFLKQRLLRALRALRKHPKADALGRELQDTIRQIAMLDPHLDNLTAEHFALILRDKIGTMEAEQRIYRGQVTDVRIVGRTVLADLLIIPTQSVEYISFRFTIV